MSIDAKIILEKQFETVRKGYDALEVNKFLDEVIEGFKALEDKVKKLEAEVEENKVKLEKYSEMEEALKNSIITAQKSADNLLRDAKNRSDMIISEAESKARRMQEEYKNSYADIRSKYADLVTSFHASRDEISRNIEMQLDRLRGTSIQSLEELESRMSTFENNHDQ